MSQKEYAYLNLSKLEKGTENNLKRGGIKFFRSKI